MSTYCWMKLTCWRKCSTLQMPIALISLFAVISVLSLTAALPLEGANWNASVTTSQSCVNAEWHYAAAEVRSKINPEIRPCDDFYRFACGKFIEDVKLQKDDNYVNGYKTTSKQIAEQMKLVITEERPPTYPKHYRLPNLLYKGCMNTRLIEDLGTTPITRIAESLGGWPLIKGESWDTDCKWSWVETATKFSKLGFYNKGLFSVKVDHIKTKFWVLTIDQADLDIDAEILLWGFRGTPWLEEFYTYMLDIAVLFGADRGKVQKELMEVVEFKIGLAKIFHPNNIIRHPIHLNGLEQLQRMYPFVHWIDYINALLPEGLVVDEHDFMDVAVPSFFDGLGPLLAKTPKRVIANYLLWRIHNHAVPFLSKKFRQRHLEFLAAMPGVTKIKPRWQECVEITQQSLPTSVGSMYVQTNFMDNTKDIAQEIVNNTQSTFEDMLTKAAWMDDITKQEAKSKLLSMKVDIGYPDEWLDNTKLERYYRKLEINPDKYFESILNVSSFRIESSFKKLYLPVKTTEWEEYSLPYRVYPGVQYDSRKNHLTISVASLQGQYFNKLRPAYMNYGTFGFFVGYGITNAFGPNGQKYDKEGNLANWWQPGSQKSFQDKAACIKEQYGNYTERQTGLKLNGGKTLGTNINDNVGIKQAYAAYSKWVEGNGPEHGLPGLDYTPKQMFWISAAQVSCGKYTKRSMENFLLIDVHSPGEFSVLGSFRNMKDFAKDFKCPEGSPMNPVHKCEIW